MKRVLVACGLLLAAVSGCGRGEPVVKIGFVGPLTGDQAPQGEDMLNGIELAIDQANAAGEVMPGYKLALMVLDDQRSPTQAVAAAKKLVADPSVVAVVGHLNSSCTMPASAIYHQAKLLQVSPVSSNPDISRQGFETFYRTCATDDLQGPAAADFLVKTLAARRIFVLDDMTTYGRGLSKELIKRLEALKAEVIGHEGITQGDKDFSPILTKIKSLAPDAIYFAGMFPEASLLIRQRAELGVPGAFMAGDGAYDPVLIDLATPKAAEGVYLTSIGSDIRQIPTAQAFLAAYEAKYGPVGAYSGYTYEAANIAIAAIRKARRSDRAAVLAAMQQLGEYSGIYGVHSFDARGDTRLRDIGIFTVKDGQFVFVQSVRQ